jgi:hypothetical protein
MLGCKRDRLRLNSFCLEHGGKDATKSAERYASNAHYQTAAWKRTRTRQLSSKPICQSCEARGVVTLATDVDHLFPWSVMGEAAFTYNLLQSLCKACHSVKTGLEGKGTYRWYGPPVRDFEGHQWHSVVRNGFGRVAGVGAGGET